MALNVTFDGPNKLIILRNSDPLVSQELYSRWVDWLALEQNTKYLLAFRTVGGDTISSGQTIAPYYFLTNGWRIRPYEGNHILSVTGNLFVDEGGSPFVSTLGNYNVMITLTVSADSKVNTVAVGSGVTDQDKTDIINGVVSSNIIQKINATVNDNQALILAT